MGGGVWSCEFHLRASFALFEGAVLDRFCGFLRILADFEDFETPFFPFWSFF
jgi:hypothetical protein